MKKGDKLVIHDWRTGSVVECIVRDTPYEDESDVWIVPIEFPNGDKWNAIWNWNGKRWETQEI